jgi:hypothetical protein
MWTESRTLALQTEPNAAAPMMEIEDPALLRLLRDKDDPQLA